MVSVKDNVTFIDGQIRSAFVLSLCPVSRKLRIQYPGAIYHLMSRGDHREPVFDDEQDREGFLATLQDCCQKTVTDLKV